MCSLLERNWLNFKGEIRMNAYTKIEADAKQIVQFYNEDFLTEKQISGLYGCSPEVITDILCSKDVELRPKGFIPNKKRPAWRHADEIVRLYEEEYLSAPKIAEIYKTNSPMICRILRSKGVQIRPKTAKDHAAWRHADEIVRLYEEGHLSVAKIAEIYKCSTPVVYWILKAEVVELRLKMAKDHPAWRHADEIVKLYEEGHLSVAKIAEIYKCSTPVVYWILKAEVVELRKKR